VALEIIERLFTIVALKQGLARRASKLAQYMRVFRVALRTLHLEILEILYGE
jgi:hypothetical protein